MSEEDKEFLWGLMPEWVKSSPPKLCPTMYGTGTHKGDAEVRNRLVKIIGEPKPKEKKP